MRAMAASSTRRERPTTQGGVSELSAAPIKYRPLLYSPAFAPLTTFEHGHGRLHLHHLLASASRYPPPSPFDDSCSTGSTSLLHFTDVGHRLGGPLSRSPLACCPVVLSPALITPRFPMIHAKLREGPSDLLIPALNSNLDCSRWVPVSCFLITCAFQGHVWVG